MQPIDIRQRIGCEEEPENEQQIIPLNEYNESEELKDKPVFESESDQEQKDY